MKEKVNILKVNQTTFKDQVHVGTYTDLVLFITKQGCLGSPISKLEITPENADDVIESLSQFGIDNVIINNITLRNMKILFQLQELNMFNYLSTVFND